MGTMLVLCVGINSTNGRTLLTLQAEPGDTPFQIKLVKLANNIAKYGVLAAVFMVLSLVVAYLTIVPISSRTSGRIANEIINIFISAIVLIVVAVPEGKYLHNPYISI